VGPAESFGDRDDRGVDGAERHVGVTGDELRGPPPVGYLKFDDVEVAVGR